MPRGKPCSECGSPTRHKKVCSRSAHRRNEAPDNVVGRLLAIADLAAQLRDVNWEAEDPGLVLDAIDEAIDAWRRDFPELARPARTAPSTQPNLHAS